MSKKVLRTVLVFFAAAFWFQHASSAKPPGEKMPPRAIFLGEFSNKKFTEEHAYGVSVELWRQDSSVFLILQKDSRAIPPRACLKM